MLTLSCMYKVLVVCLMHVAKRQSVFRFSPFVWIDIGLFYNMFAIRGKLKCLLVKYRAVYPRVLRIDKRTFRLEPRYILHLIMFYVEITYGDLGRIVGTPSIDTSRFFPTSNQLPVS